MEANRIIPDRMFFRIRDVAGLVGVKPYVLRYWETEFPHISPQKSSTGQRVYRRDDVENLIMIKHLLYEERYSIEGARKRIGELKKDHTLGAAKQAAIEEALPAEHMARTERRKRISQLARELKALLRKPVREIFET